MAHPQTSGPDRREAVRQSRAGQRGEAHPSRDRTDDGSSDLPRPDHGSSRMPLASVAATTAGTDATMPTSSTANERPRSELAAIATAAPIAAAISAPREDVM